ncbi:uncharacterized protein [Apostichopus japonicus]|uniref:uncharacterized protein isoform X2 n=1 Tax=Stichopus japonicus TaxID=307972 RepID=UPI003AB63064
MASKRKQDEKNLKTLRELASREHNKKCFDCGQRGPTYVNMTIGSFVCTSCSGLLRGLNPPQRVKSISMTSFTQPEIEQLQKSGNEYCKRVWLGLWNSHLPPEPDSRDEQKVKDFLIKKYEKKTYYVPPDQVKPVTREKEKEKVPEIRPLKSLLGENSPKVQVSQNSSPSSLGSIKQPPSSSTQPVAVAPPPGPTIAAAPAQPKKPSQDLLSDLGGDPFGAPQQPQANAFNAFGGQSQGAGGFADFGQAFGGGGSQTSAFPSNPPQSQQNTFNAFPAANQAAPASSGQNAFAAFGTPATAAAQPTSQASFAAFGGTTMAPTPAAPVNQASKSLGDLSLSNSSPSQGLSNADKYSALSELDSIFSNPSGSNTSVFGATTSSSSSSSVFGQTPPSSSTASVFGQKSQTSTMFGQPAAAASQSVFGGTQTSAVQTSGMEANPFGGFAMAPSQQQPVSQPNPFMVQAGGGMVSTGQSNGMFGSAPQAAGGFAWDASPQPQAAQGFKQPQAAQGYTQPQAAQGYAQPQAAQGFAQPQAAQGYTQPQAAQGFAQPQAAQGFTQPQAAQGFGQMPQQNSNMGGFGQFAATPGMGTTPGMVGQPSMMGQQGMPMGAQPQLGAMQANGNVGRGVPAAQHGSMNMGYNMQAQGGFGVMGGMQYNKPGQVAGGFGQMAPVQQPQQAQFGTWNPSGGAVPQQRNPFMGHSAAGMPPKGQSSNPFM